jgi:hypothetical protein
MCSRVRARAVVQELCMKTFELPLKNLVATKTATLRGALACTILLHALEVTAVAHEREAGISECALRTTLPLDESVDHRVIIRNTVDIHHHQVILYTAWLLAADRAELHEVRADAEFCASVTEAYPMALQSLHEGLVAVCSAAWLIVGFGSTDHKAVAFCRIRMPARFFVMLRTDNACAATRQVASGHIVSTLTSWSEKLWARAT